jgi:hypothetical protein
MRGVTSNPGQDVRQPSLGIDEHVARHGLIVSLR